MSLVSSSPFLSHPLTNHSLQQTDRDALKSAASKVGTHATVGSIIGLGLGVFLAFRLRQNRTAMFRAFKAVERPTSVQFANGRTGIVYSLYSPFLILLCFCLALRSLNRFLSFLHSPLTFFQNKSPTSPTCSSRLHSATWQPTSSSLRAGCLLAVRAAS